jgi:hypothetical protein
MLYGEQVYRDFFQFTPPGAELLYLGAFRLFGPRIWAANLVVLLLSVALSALCLRISKSIMPATEAALATSVYLVFAIGLTLNGTHHWFSCLAVMGAVALLMEGRSPLRIAVAGALLGVATFFTQTRGPIAAVAIGAWMMWEKCRLDEPWSKYVRNQALLLATLIVTLTALSSYFIATVGMRQLWFFQVTYVREYEVSGWNTRSIDLLDGHSWTMLVEWLFAYTVVPVVYVICFWRWWRISRVKPSDTATRVALLTLVGTAMWVEVAQSPSWFRFFCVSLPGVILLVWLVGGAGRFAGYATRLLWVGVLGLAAFLTWSRHMHYAIEELPAGRVAAGPSDAEKLRWLVAHTKPGEFMLLAEYQKMYLPLALRSPIFADTVAPGEGRGELRYLALTVRQLEEKHVEFILESPARSLPVFHEFLLDRYRLILRFSDRDELWERKPEAAVPGR